MSAAEAETGKKRIINARAKTRMGTPFRPLETLPTQISRLPPAQGLPLIAGFRPIRGSLPPICGLSGEPVKGAASIDREQGLRRIVRIVAGKAQLATRLYDPGERGCQLRRDQPPLGLPLLRPGIREQNESARDRACGQPGKHVACIPIMDADALEPLGLDLTEETRGAVDEGLATNKADLGIVLCLPQHNPKIGFIGCEPFINGAASLLGEIETKGLESIRVHDGDARDVLAWLPPGSIARAFILFPDPWPKKRQAKRRLVSPELAAALARVIKPGGELRFASDDADYAAQALLAVNGSGAFDWLARKAADWRERPADWPETRYERKALSGRKPTYLSWQRL